VTESPTQITIKVWTDALRDSDLAATDRHVAEVLASYCNWATGEGIRVSVARLERDTGRSESTVRRSIARLHQLGWFKYADANARGGRSMAARRRLNLPERVSPATPFSDETLAPATPFGTETLSPRNGKGVTGDAKPWRPRYPTNKDQKNTNGRPPWCGVCHEQTRMIEDPQTAEPTRCPNCHPRADARTA
jgi:hypothetical protein